MADVIQIHDALTKIWPEGITPDQFPFLAGMAKLMCEAASATVATERDQWKETARRRLGEIAHARATTNAPGTPPIDTIANTAKTVDNGEVTVFGRKPTSIVDEAYARVRAAQAAMEKNPIDSSGRVSQTILRQVYAYVIANPKSGVSMASDALKISFAHTKRAFSVLTKLKLIKGASVDGRHNQPWVYSAS